MDENGILKYTDEIPQDIEFYNVLNREMSKFPIKTPISARNQRDFLLKENLWKIERHAQQKELGIQTSLSNELYFKLLEHTQYLRNVPQQPGNWWETRILNFEKYMETSA